MKTNTTHTNLLTLAISHALSAFAPGKPNVVFILADDLGWADTTLYGHTKLYETPNLERLASRGMLFNRSYAAPLCSPTRTAILSGQNNTRNGSTAPAHHIFTFFPHNPPVPDWLPPSICVHSGNWKLIRLFHQGENGTHAYRLYNLTNDIGETLDLSKEKPGILRKLDTLIETHLAETKAVVPIPNPAFDPAKYNPDSIGIQPGGLKVEGGARRPAPRGTPKSQRNR